MDLGLVVFLVALVEGAALIVIVPMWRKARKEISLRIQAQTRVPRTTRGRGEGDLEGG